MLLRLNHPLGGVIKFENKINFYSLISSNLEVSLDFKWQLKRVPDRFFGIRDWAYLKDGIREFEVRRERDVGLSLLTGHGTRESVILKKRRRRGKWDRVRFPSSDEESDESFPDDETAYDDGYSIFGKRDSFSPVSEKVFTSTAELCSVDFFFISLFMEAMGLFSPCFVLCTNLHWYSFLWYWHVLLICFSEIEV